MCILHFDVKQQSPRALLLDLHCSVLAEIFFFSKVTEAEVATARETQASDLRVSSARLQIALLSRTIVFLLQNSTLWNSK